jgi:Icc protein
MTDEITFVQISDTHILADDGEVMGMRPARQLARVLARIAALPTPPRFCLHTGDLIHDSGVAGYAHLRRLLAPLGMPLVAALGNHDDRAAFRQGFLGEADGGHHRGFPGEADGDERRYRQAREFDGLRVIALDSLVPGAIGGELGREQLAWLAQALSQPAPRGVLIALHHPVALAGFSYLTDGLLRDASALAALLARRPILGVLAGHCHAPSATAFAGTTVVTAPAVACQFAPDTPDAVISVASGFNLCTIRDGALLVTPVMV